jgi:hypothetical protein
VRSLGADIQTEKSIPEICSTGVGQTGALKRHEQWMHDFETKMLEIEDKLNALIDIKRNGMEGTKGGTSV